MREQQSGGSPAAACAGFSSRRPAYQRRVEQGLVEEQKRALARAVALAAAELAAALAAASAAALAAAAPEPAAMLNAPPSPAAPPGLAPLRTSQPPPRAAAPRRRRAGGEVGAAARGGRVAGVPAPVLASHGLQSLRLARRVRLEHLCTRGGMRR